ncbi:hypothetical protein ElyMa_006827000 [Elysia marginata]|uniref:Uncharacterized protein n=1 Tax=Elysia marginata TaxID=1093978 RepID=A0AAV4J6P9_9GAST|nr:hypothetical protein ElyMa_006827000 [Elysia marginata]
MKEKTYSRSSCSRSSEQVFHGALSGFHRQLIDNKSVHEINSHLEALQKDLETLAREASKICKGVKIFPPQYYSEEDPVREELLKSTGDCELDSLTQVAT